MAVPAQCGNPGRGCEGDGALVSQGAQSQCIGGMVGGIGMALMERAALDPRNGRQINAHMADYLSPVNLNIPSLEAHFVDEVDPHVNSMGVKGVGEIALVGMAPAGDLHLRPEAGLA